MELRQYLKVFKKNFLVVVVLCIFGLLLGYFLAMSRSEGFQQDQTLYIAPQTTDTQNYEGFYGQEKARNFTDTAVAILESPDFKAEIQGSGESLSVRKIAPQVIKITTTAKDPQGAKNLMAKVTSTFNSKLQTVSNNQAKIELKELGKLQEPAPIIINKKVSTLAGLVLGFAFAILAISLKTYFKL